MRRTQPRWARLLRTGGRGGDRGGRGAAAARRARGPAQRGAGALPARHRGRAGRAGALEFSVVLSGAWRLWHFFSFEISCIL